VQPGDQWTRAADAFSEVVAVDMTVFAATERDLDEIRKSSPEVANSALAAAALALAGEIDGDNSATSKSMCAGVLAKLMEGLREQAPKEVTASGLDELTKRRDERLARKASGA
jgi:hypothetical protein